MLTNFRKFQLEVNGITINGIKGGRGFPLLLLHGYPQTHQMWHKIAPRLAANFTVIATDLRGYGDSDKPLPLEDSSNYCKRVIALDQVLLMEKLGYQEFYLIGHDRGARVSHRLALDFPEKVKKLVLLDIAPTLAMYEATNQTFATAYYHWFFLIQPSPFPETLIAANPDYYLQHCLQSWGRDFSAFTEEALGEYQRCFRDLRTITATCADYRAAATIDLEHDRQDLDRKISSPLLVLWGEKGFIARQYDVIALWQQRANQVTGQAIASGHFLPEEAPEETGQAIEDFLQ
ncbi:MAG: alpha/beta hydrolase [Microcystis aeruginosa Ma_QC_Ch_20071001_S25]|uniref:Alpha/beta hydrolase n=1 Tax=Microcystis aeruginosa Ma_QC_Ch_20071001_S25D TaxID=2486250 RepID=A0A552G6M5_MICAE|nr:MAG: alpha/beta hydrolase [Microcystis aeruginosa Ma_QC_Ch_20071001_S25]TRU54556.1 MAG: alpha/beta hydrolase [Microcystis aeruginosa Ma_QC_Ch_20071001_S25D]TRU64283.1 MAG: alpha/beta hydrolase [Microcystis aeruginosa Ma_QC_Ch_20071001_M135]